MRSWAVVVFMVLGLIFWGRPSFAALIFCNHTQQVLESSVAYRSQNQWVSEGWWHLQPHECTRVLEGNLKQRFYYYFARNSEPPRRYWSGKYAFCVAVLPYRLYGSEECAMRGYQSYGFAVLDTRDLPHFMLDFNQ